MVRILLIDNNTFPLDIVKTKLSFEKNSEPCEFINVNPGNADNMILSGDADLILLNSALLDKISSDVLEDLKQRDFMDRIMILCFSANPSDDETLEAFKAGARDYLYLRPLAHCRSRMPPYSPLPSLSKNTSSTSWAWVAKTVGT